MKPSAFLLAVWLATMAPATRAAEPPVRFARSGQSLTIDLDRGGDWAGEGVALFAYGRKWDAALTVKEAGVEVAAPRVRVPVAFRVAGANTGNTYAELVVYPDRPVVWDKDVQLAAVGASAWFDSWVSALDLPVHRFPNVTALGDSHWRKLEKNGLLIVVDHQAAGAGPQAIERLAVDYRVNVVVLEARWFGKVQTFEHAFTVGPKQMVGALAELQTQRWSAPPRFRQHTLPWQAVANRQAWIAGEAYPLVEEIRGFSEMAEPLRIIASYIPWQEQLGRCEIADELFLRLLAETANGAGERRSLGRNWRLLSPSKADVAPAERPVLASASQPAGDEVAVFVLDVRGAAPVPDEFFERETKLLEERVSAATPLLILGDRPVLDSWKWLQLDRREYRSSRAGVFWWPDNALPPSFASQLRLMQFFTEWNIALPSISQENR